MRYSILIGLFLFPTIVSAACLGEGTTVVYINGIFTTDKKAKEDLENLKLEFLNRNNTEKVKFINGYNPTHLEGVGDIVQSYTQLVGKPIGTYDLRTILMQIHPQVTTRKVLLVGHSQGSFYANEIYDYFLSHGVPREAVLTYAIAAPSYKTAPGGTYLSSRNDALLNEIEKWDIPLLPRNITIPVAAGDTASRWPGHGITKAYLAGAAERVVGDMQKQIAKLEPTFASDKGECFSAPEADWAYKATGAAFAVADPLATGLKKGGQLAAAVGSAAAAGVKKVAGDIGTAIGGIKGLSKAADGSGESRATNFDIFSKLYGSSLTSDEVRELLGNGGGAVVSAPVFAAEPKQEGEVAGAEDDAGDPPPTRRYVSSANDNAEPEPEVVEEPVLEDEPLPEEPVEPEEPTEPEEPEEAEPPVPIFVGGSPVEDDFDSGVSGWDTIGVNGVLFYATSTDCYAGDCVVGDTMNPQVARMYKMGDELDAGAFTVYIRAREGSHTPFFNPRPVVELCSAGNSCSDGSRIPGIEHKEYDDEWHRYLVAWRQGTAVLEVCVLQDSVDVEGCEWEETEKPAGTYIDGIAISSSHGYRPDLGGEFWFDELEGYEP